MYQHLLVPIDGSPLSGPLVEQALALARCHGAHVTFLHARPDFSSSSDGAVLHAAEPGSFVRGAAGNARAVLAKAESAARAAGVSHRSVAAVHERPHEAILETATREKCDLIVMASHGRRGLKGALLGSVTQKVLQQATLPVLVSAVESNLPQTDAQRALAIVRDEHRSLAAVIHGLVQVSAQMVAGTVTPDFSLLRAMLFYIEKFPERLHHPKEEAFLFRRLRERTSECDSVVEDLVAQHHEGSELFAELGRAVATFEQEHMAGRGHAAASIFESVVQRFAESQWRHMSAEEKVVLPAADRHLRDADWREIAEAFSSNGDPRFGYDAQEAFTDLFTRLLNLLPVEQRSPDPS